MSDLTVGDSKRIFELADASTGDGLLVLYLAVDHPSFPEAKRVLVGSLPSGSGGGLPATIMLNDGSVPFTAPITGVAGTADEHLAVKSQVDDAAESAAAAQATAVAAGSAASSAQSVATAAQTTASAAMPKTGGTFTGAIIVPLAVTDNHPATLGQLNSAIGGLPPSGGPDPATAAPLPPAATAAVGASVKYAREDHVHQTQTVPTASNATPASPGAAAPGSSASFSRADHVHGLQDVSTLMPKAGGTFTGAVVVIDAAAANQPASKGQLDGAISALPTPPAPSSAAPQAPGVAAAGSNTTYSRSDHVHPLQDVSALMPKSGGTFTGAVVVADALAANQPASKGQLDTAITGRQAASAFLTALAAALVTNNTFAGLDGSGAGVSRALSALGITLLASNDPNIWRMNINQGTVTLTDGTTISTNCALGNVFLVTLAGTPRTLANPTNVVAGASYNWFIVQDGTGSRPLTLGSNFKLGVDSAGAAITYTPSTAAGAVDLLSAVARTTTSLATAVLKGVQ